MSPRLAGLPRTVKPVDVGNIVTNPVVGQDVYPHFVYNITAPGPITGTITEISLDGGSLCSLVTTTYPGLWVTWCASPWTATEGNHVLLGVADPNDEFAEANEANNEASENYTVGDALIFSDDFESGDTSAWSSQVP